jgi:hypothetical protein
MATPANLKNFLEQTRLTNVKLCFDTGHAHIEGGVPPALETVRDLVATTHLHDNRGERDEHLLPYEGRSTGAPRWRRCRPSAHGPRIERAGRGRRFRRGCRRSPKRCRGVRTVFEKFDEELAQVARRFSL